MRLSLSYNDLGDDPENLRFLFDGLKKMIKLDRLYLEYSIAKLGENTENFRYMGEGLKKLN